MPGAACACNGLATACNSSLRRVRPFVSTRPEIEAIRGVGSDSVLRTLLSVGLIEGVGRAPTVGRPILYGTTFEFLQHFGLRGLDELPPLEELSN